MRAVNKVFIHCSASDNKNHDDISVIKQWHLERGFNDVGYHFFIKKDGEIQKGRPLEKTPAAQKGHNTGSIAVCLSGLDQFTQKQFDALRRLCERFDDEYTVTFHGHREVSNKLCPNFEYKSVLRLDSDGRMIRPPLPEQFTCPKPKPSFWDRLRGKTDYA